MKKLNNFIAIIAVCLLLASCSWLFPKPDMDTITEPEIKVVKEYMVQAGFGSGNTYLRLTPEFSDHKIITTDYSGRVTVLEQDTGERIWYTKLRRALTSSPGVGDGKIFVGTDKAKLMALDLKDGKKLWQVPLPSQMLSTPKVSNGVLIVKTLNGTLQGRDVKDGKVLWSYHENVPRLTLRGNSSPVVEYPVAVVGFADGRLVEVTVDDGKLVFERTVAEPTGFSDLSRMVDIDSDPVIFENVVYVTSYQGNISAVDLHNGKMLWQHKLSSHAGLAVSRRGVFVTDTSGRIWSFDPLTGAVNWRQNDLESHQITGPAAIDGYVVVADQQGFIHWLDQEDGHFLARQFFTPNGVIAQPKVDSNRVYVLSRAGTLVALKPKPLDAA